MIAQTAPVVWVKVDKPVFDLWGVIVSSLSLTLILALVALVVGCLLGLWLVARERKRPPRGGPLLPLYPAPGRP